MLAVQMDDDTTSFTRLHQRHVSSRELHNKRLMMIVRTSVIFL